MGTVLDDQVYFYEPANQYENRMFSQSVVF